MTKYKVKKYDIEQFNSQGVWEATSTCTFKKGCEKDYEFGPGRSDLVKKAAIELLSADSFYKISTNWTQVVVKFGQRGCLITRAEFQGGS